MATEERVERVARIIRDMVKEVFPAESIARAVVTELDAGYAQRCAACAVPGLTAVAKQMAEALVLNGCTPGGFYSSPGAHEAGVAALAAYKEVCGGD